MLGVSLFRFVDEGVQQTIQGYNRQMNTVVEQALNPLNQVLQQTDSMWRGVGAEAFKEELQSVHVPQTNTFIEMLTQAIKNYTQASEVIKKADQDAKNVVSQFEDDVEKIIGF